MSTGDALQSPLTTATSQITGKRKRVGSTDESGNADDDQDDGHDPRKQNHNLQDFLVDIVEILRRFVSFPLLYLARIYKHASSLRGIFPFLGCELQTNRPGHLDRTPLHPSWTTRSLPLLGMARHTMQNGRSCLNRRRSPRSHLGSSPGSTPALKRLPQISRQLFPRSFTNCNRKPLL